ncbi:hypothetical protein GJAV_G00198150 [Gymnothorax javanicus]|nr:hypothetical protein GJAV_G00198150 [Gymnothorax javanicus]
MTSQEQDCDKAENLLLNYEDESFESCSGSDNTCTSSSALQSQRTYLYDSNSFLSFAGTEFNSLSLSRSTPSSEGYENDDFEEYDEKESAMAEDLREKWIRILRSKEPSSPIAPLKRRSNCSLRRGVSPVVSGGGGKLCPEERAALKAFCQEQIKRVQSLQRTSPPAEQFISVLKLKTFSQEMKKAVGTELHQPSRCVPCREVLAQLAEDAFVRRKKSHLESRLLQDKLQAHLLQRDAICLVGELLSDIPDISDDPNKIWQELLTKRTWSPS